MKAKYWTTNGSDIWTMRRVFEFRNLETDEVVTVDNVTDVKDKKFTPVTMPEIKKKRKYTKRKYTKRKSKHIGVKPSSTPGKFVGQAWDKKTRKNVHLGTFDSELLAAAAYQEHIGNKKEAQRLRNEYEEGNCQPETVHKRMFEEDTPNRAMSPSEE